MRRPIALITSVALAGLLARPRDAADIRTHPRFHDIHKAIWGQLRAEVIKTYGEDA